MSHSTTAARKSGGSSASADSTSSSNSPSITCTSGEAVRLGMRVSASSASASNRILVLRRAWSRNRLVVMRCSQPSKVPGVYDDSDRKTRTKTSWVRSSASCGFPVRR
jgi:hypothetical protein